MDINRKNNYEDWLNMSDLERKEIVNHWNPYLGEGKEILQFVVDLFRKQYKHIPGILGITTGLYHGGVYIIEITIRKGAIVKIPTRFLGFAVIKVRE